MAVLRGRAHAGSAVVLIVALLAGFVAVPCAHASEADWRDTENARAAALCATAFRELRRPADEAFFSQLAQAQDYLEPHAVLARVRLQFPSGSYDDRAITEAVTADPSISDEAALVLLQGAASLLRAPNVTSENVWRAGNALRQLARIDASSIPLARSWALAVARAELTPRTSLDLPYLLGAVSGDEFDSTMRGFLLDAGAELLKLDAREKAAVYARMLNGLHSARQYCDAVPLLRDVALSYLRAGDHERARWYLDFATRLDPSVETEEIFFTRRVTLACRRAIGAKQYLDRFPKGAHRTEARSIIREDASSPCHAPVELGPEPPDTPPRPLSKTPCFIRELHSSMFEPPAVEVVVDACGAVRSVRPRGFISADELESLWCWKFEPAKRAGRAVAGKTSVKLTYTADNDEERSTDNRRIYPDAEHPPPVETPRLDDEELARLSWKCSKFDSSLFPEPFRGHMDIQFEGVETVYERFGCSVERRGTPCIDDASWRIVYGRDGRIEEATVIRARFAGDQSDSDAARVAEEERYKGCILSTKFKPATLRGQPVRSVSSGGVQGRCKQ